MGRRAEARWWWPPVLGALALLASLVLGCRRAAPVPVTPVSTVSGRRAAPAQPTSVARTPTQMTETVAPTFTLTAASTPKATLTLALSPPSAYGPQEAGTVTLAIVYDNNAYPGSKQSADSRLASLRSSWGFACWVDTTETTILFDTGGDGATLMHNLEALNLDPLTIDTVVLSHAHDDHTGGLGALLGTGVKPAVYVPASFSRSFKSRVRAQTDLVEVSDPTTIVPGIHTTGELGTDIREQALVVETTVGLVVITGCAHPGVDNLVRRAQEHVGDRIALVVGGFHLGGASRGRVEDIFAALRGMGVQRVAPCHCTGDAARSLFDHAFGDDCILAGVGWSNRYVFGAGDQAP